MHQDHNCTLIWQAPQAYSSWLNYEDLSPGIPNELQTHCVSEFPQNGSFSKSTQILEIHSHISLVKMTHFWDIDHWNMIFRQKVANGPDLIFVELSLERLLWGAHTHSINVLLHTCIHYTLRQISIFVLKNRIFKINSDKVYLRNYWCRIWIFWTKLNISAQCVLMMRLCEFTTTTERSIQSFPSLERKLRKLKNLRRER